MVLVMVFVSILGSYKAGTHLNNKKATPILAYKKCKKVDLMFYRPTDISVDGEIERVKGKVTFSVVKDAVTLSLPKACQPIEIDSAVAKAAKRLNKKNYNA